jgi:hypothetical protein
MRNNNADMPLNASRVGRKRERGLGKRLGGKVPDTTALLFVSRSCRDIIRLCLSAVVSAWDCRW